MALTQNSKILVSDINTALSGKQDALGYTPVKTVNGVGVDSNANVSISYVDSCNYANSAGSVGIAYALSGVQLGEYDSSTGGFSLVNGGTWAWIANNPNSRPRLGVNSGGSWVGLSGGGGFIAIRIA